MRMLVMVLSCVVCMYSSALAEDTSIEDVISAQIEAFKQEDVEKAFTFASPMIQQLFRSPENFGNMVQNRYPMVWQPSDVSFLRQKNEGDVVYQVIRFFDAKGLGTSFVYEMVRVSGEWKINGVFKIQSDDVSASLQLKKRAEAKHA